MNFLLIILIMFSMVSCSTIKKSFVFGTGTGAAAGAIGASMLANNNKGQAALQGALVGGAIGGLASYFIHKGIDKRDERIRRETLFNLEKFNVSTPINLNKSNSEGPGMSIPKVEAQWVDTQVQGKKLVEGHRVWIITEDPQWIPNLNKDKNHD